MVVIGYCRLWIPTFAELAKPLYESTFGPHLQLDWIARAGSFLLAKVALASVPVLAFPDITKPFQLFMHEAKGISKGVLI